MATLKTNYKDDVLDVTQNELRKFNVINNDDGTISLVDVTKYSQTGDKFGAKDVNGIVEAINEHKNNKSNPHEVTKEQVGLGNADNTSDLNKPVSTLQQVAIENALNQAKEYTDNSKITIVTGVSKKLSSYSKIGIYYFSDCTLTDLPEGYDSTGWLINISATKVSTYRNQIWLTVNGEMFIRRIIASSANLWQRIPSWDYITDNIYQKTEVDTMFNNHLLVKSFDVSLETLAAAGGGTAYGTFDTNIATEGYTPVGVVGFNSNGTNGTSMTYGEMYVSGNKLYVLARNTNTSKACDSTSKVNVQVLYTKNV
jgi:hypothetical protein